MAKATLIFSSTNTIATKTIKEVLLGSRKRRASERKMMSSHALTTAITENSSRILSAKPEWDKSQARFIKRFRMEKEGESCTATPVHIASSLSFSPFGHHKVTEEGDKVFSFGSDITGSPDNYVCRQRYLRSYVFSREEESDKSVIEKVRRLFKGKKKGKGKAKGKSENNNSCCRRDICLKFLLGCIAKVDVQAKAPAS